MANLAFPPRLGRRSLLSLILVTGSLASYACGDSNTDGVDGLGGLGGSGIVVTPPSGGASSGGSGTGGSTAAKAPFASCTLPGQGTLPSDSLVIDDFEDGDAVTVGNGLYGLWYQFDDMTGGTQTPSWNQPNGWLPEEGGVDEDGYALHVVGGGFSEWGSGQGMAPIWNEELNQECLFDASNFDGISFWIKGEIDGSASPAPIEDRGVVRVGFQEADVVPVDLGGNCGTDAGCYDWHKFRVAPTECWRKIVIPFEAFEQDDWGLDAGELNLDEIVNFNLEISQGNTFDYWIDQFEFWSGTAPAADEVCDDDGAGGAGGQGGAGP